MRRKLYRLLAVMAMLVMPMLAWAAGQATPDEAKAMAVKAAAYLQSAGPEKAFPEFDAKDGPWRDRDLYVTVQNRQGVMVAHGTNPGLIGRSVLELKDVDGKPFNHEIHEIKDAGWVDLQMAESADQGGRAEDDVRHPRWRLHCRCRCLCPMSKASGILEPSEQ